MPLRLYEQINISTNHVPNDNISQLHVNSKPVTQNKKNKKKKRNKGKKIKGSS